MKYYLLAIDQGTTGSTALVIDSGLSVLARGYREFRQIYPKPGWVEHDPRDIWDSVCAAVKEALAKSHIKPSRIEAVGITNQRETTILWERQKGRALHNAIVWQCRRTKDICDKLKVERIEGPIQRRTGLLLDPYFSASKLKWLLDNVKGARKRAEKSELAFGTVDSYLLWQLTGGEMHYSDVTNASRTMLFNIHTISWDDYLLKLFDIPKTLLPEVQSSTGLFGVTSDKFQKILPAGIPITGIAGDQQAALFGQGCFNEGDAKCTFGTGSFMVMNTGKKPVASKNRLLTTIAWQVGKNPPVYALEGSCFISGAVVQWLRDELKLIEKASDIEALAASVKDSGGVFFVPALAGLGAPHWRSDARGVITGISRGTNRGHIARAALEGMALQNADVLLAMEIDSKRRLKRLKVDGGAAVNDMLMQYQADILGVKIARPAVLESTALGAAALAAVGAGLIEGTAELERKLSARTKIFTPKIREKEREAVLKAWRDAVKKA
ncbi:MAG: glycerol kinase GlpK [Myxococcota bacterium]